MVVFVSVGKILLYSRIYKHISTNFSLTTLRETENRRKFKKASFMTLWANILEVFVETMTVVFILISYGKGLSINHVIVPNGQRVSQKVTSGSRQWRMGP